MDSADKKPRNEMNKVGQADDKNLPAATRDKIVEGLANINGANISKVLTTVFSQAELAADVVNTFSAALSI